MTFIDDAAVSVTSEGSVDPRFFPSIKIVTDYINFHAKEKSHARWKREGEGERATTAGDEFLEALSITFVDAWV